MVPHAREYRAMIFLAHRGARSPTRLALLPRPSRRLLLVTLLLLIPLLLEAFLHWRAFDIPRPAHDLDPPFQTGCREPAAAAAATPRERAALVMLARNSEAAAALRTVQSVEARFNRWFHYPYVFLNDEPWDPDAVRRLNLSVSGPARFEVIPPAEWTFPPWMDRAAARQSIARQGRQGVHYGGREGYHHMCRFFSGKFYTLEALRPYKWYWRLEPDVSFSCSVTYDPFAAMARARKVYGWAIALWEEPATAPTLYRAAAAFKARRGLRTTHLWTAMAQASWLPFPLRRWLRGWPLRDGRAGDAWSLCHYWSNFEIADLDFFRGREYQELFEYLDAQGGFYNERWGDAPVHSLAVGMLLEPERVHHFSDLAYRHDTFEQCPANAPGLQLAGSVALGDAPYSEEKEGGVGCRCGCDASKTINFPGYCMNKLRQPTRPDRPWFTWFL